MNGFKNGKNLENCGLIGSRGRRDDRRREDKPKQGLHTNKGGSEALPDSRELDKFNKRNVLALEPSSIVTIEHHTTCSSRQFTKYYHIE